MVAVAVAAAALTLLDHRTFRARHAELMALVARPEVVAVADGLEATVRRETDLDRTASGIARLLLFAEVGRAEGGVAGAAREAAEARLDLALELGASVLRVRPTMESAAAAVGGANYLRLRRARDRRLVAEARLWEAPLELARSLKAGSDGSRLLAVAYLELWPFLSTEKQQVARELLGEAFRDQRLFGRLVESWLQIAADRDEAFSLVPDRVVSWTTLERLYASRRDWEGFLLAVHRRDEALRHEIAETLDDAAALARQGNVSRASEQYLGVLSRLPPAAENVALARRVLVEAPAAAPQERLQAGIRAWLDWTLDLCRGAGCPFPAEVIDRLRSRAGELPPPTRALAALFGGRPVSEQVGGVAPEGGPAWTDYLVARARSLAEAGELGAAVETLAQVHPSGTLGASYWLARREVARAGGDAAGLERAELELDRLARSSWPSSEWEVGRSAEAAATLRFFARRPASELVVALDAPSTGAAVEVRLDGALLSLAVVSGRAEVELETPIAAGLHRLEVVSRGGGSISPSAASLGD
jgi:hypothetical protein